MMEFEPFYLSFKLAAITTILLLAIGLPLAYWLAFHPKKIKVIMEAFVGLPLVLPPTVLGFYLLVAFSPDNFLGRFLDSYFDTRLVFSFPGLVIASIIYSFPFMIQPLQTGFRAVPAALIEASYTLGKSRLTTLTKVLLPNMTGSLLTASILTFAHTVGEFGVVLMVGGNIPGQTKVVSISIYDEVESMNYDLANYYSAILLIFSFLILVTVYWVNYHRNQKLQLL